jgi:hypothetical protein
VEDENKGNSAATRGQNLTKKKREKEREGSDPERGGLKKKNLRARVSFIFV